MNGVVEAFVVAGLLVGAGVLVLLVHVALRDLAVSVELARGHAMQGACLRLVAMRARRPRRALVVRRVHGGRVVVKFEATASEKKFWAEVRVGGLVHLRAKG